MSALRSVKRLWAPYLKWADVAFQMIRGILVAPHAYMIFFVTARCNARCGFCFYWEQIETSAQRKELSLAEIEKITRSLKHLLYLSIGGGEPFLRKDLADIVGLFYRNCRTRFVNITTNALQPERTEELVERMLVENPNLSLKVNLSLDAEGEAHDLMRRVPGTFDKLRETHDRLCAVRQRQRFFGVNVATTFSAFNEDVVEGLIDYVHAEFDVNDHTMTYVRGDAKEKEALQASIEKYKRAVDYLQTRYTPAHLLFRTLHSVLRVMFQINIDTLEQNRMIVPCVAGGKMITLDDQGMLKPCEMLEQLHKTNRFDIGNVRDAGYDILSLTRSDKAGDIRKWIRDTECHCTFECANMANVVFNHRSWPRVIRESLAPLWGGKGAAPRPARPPGGPPRVAVGAPTGEAAERELEISR